MRRKILTLATLSSLLLTACGGETNFKTEALNVRVEEVKSESQNNNSITYVGTVESATTTAVSFNASGVLTRVCVREGQQVRKGDLIAELDKTQAENMITAAKASVMQADDAYARMKKLHETASIPEMDWVEVQSKVEQAHVQLEMAQKNLQDCELRAPSAGIVGSGIRSVGEVILPAMPIANILNIQDVKIKASVPEKEIALISADTRTTIKVDAIGGAEFLGGKIEKGIEADPLTHTYNILVNVNNSDQKLLPGMVCQVYVQKYQNSDKNEYIALPIRCIQQDSDGRNFVWTASDGKATRKAVETGEVIGNKIVINQGLATGDKVITSGYQKVSEGSEINIIK
ncbi:MAG: efflux RND transporter periplasmic adaptor subunit [Bacteroidales bacterium]|nr:efflux RND transporter periplasmic adaptor subunit [Bacteroidales bacterium]